VRNDPDLLIEARRLSKHYSVRGSAPVRALSDVSLTIARGERVGLVGESGSGKTTLANCLLAIDDPTGGELVLFGNNARDLRRRELKQLRRRIQMVFQDPLDSLNPRMRVREIIAEPLLLARIARREREEQVASMLDLLKLKSALASRWPHQLSGGEQQRVGLARALITKPEVLILDEPTSSLDVSVRGEILDLILELQRTFDLTYLFISHDLTTVQKMCDRVLVMYLGRVVESAPTELLFRDPLHPYSRGLIGSALIAGTPRLDNRVELKGEPPSPINVPPGCALSPRCPFARESCFRNVQVLEELPGSRAVACEVVTEAVGDRRAAGSDR